MLRWGDNPGLPNWTLSVITSVIVRGGRGRFDFREEKPIWQWKQTFGVTCFENKGRGHRQRKARDVELEAGKDKDMDHSLESPKEVQSCQHLELKLTPDVQENKCVLF